MQHATAGDAPTAPMIQVRHVSVAFDGRRVLHDICLDVPRGRTVVVIGQTGCGKTVLLKTMIGLVAPSAGEVLVDGADVAALDERALTRLRARIGFVFQGAALFDSLSVSRNVAFGLRELTDFDDARIEDIVRDRLREVGLDPRQVWDKRPAQLSGGMRKRVGLARTLAPEPEIMLYDEPTTGLDPVMSGVIGELILRTKQRRAVTAVVVTHDMKSAFKLGDRIVMLDQGRIIASAPPEEFAALPDPKVRQFVQGEAGEPAVAVGARCEQPGGTGAAPGCGK